MQHAVWHVKITQYKLKYYQDYYHIIATGTIIISKSMLFININTASNQQKNTFPLT